MTNGQPPRRPPVPPPLPLDKVRPVEERFAPPPDQRGAPRNPGQSPQHGPPPRHGQPAPYPGPSHPGQHPPHLAQRPSGRPGAPGHPGQPPPPSGRRAPPPPRRSTLGSIALIAMIGIGIVIAAGAAFILLAPPTDLIREQAIALVKERTGRDLVIRGPASLTLYPSLGVSLEDVSLSAPPGMSGPPTVAMASLDVSVKLMPLLQRRVEVRRLVLTRPTFDLRVDKSGRNSWELAAPAADDPARYAQVTPDTLSDAARAPLVLAQAGPAARRGGASTSHLAELKDIVLDDVRIVDGKLAYADARTGATHAASAINAALRARTLSAPLTAKGDLKWQGQAVRFDATLTTPYEILTRAPAKLSLKLLSAPVDADYTGNLDLSTGTSLDGSIAVVTQSVRALAQWLGQKLPENDGFGPMRLDARIKSHPGAVQLANTDITLDAMRITGSIDATSTGTRPHLKADLKIAGLNLNTYLGSGGHAGRPTAPPSAGRSAPAAAPAPVAPNATPQSIEDLLERQSGPRVKGYTARSGWSDEPIDTAILGLVDADAKVALDGLIVRDIRIGQSDLTLSLKNRIAKALFDRVDLYGGTGRGQIDIDAGAPSPTIAASLVIDGVDAEPFLKDAASLGWLSGKGKLTLATTASGQTQRQLVSALDGKANFFFTDGAIKGFNVAKAMRGLQQGRLTSISATPTEKTDFSQLSASFDIIDGIATNQDLTMLSPLLRISGNGRVMLPDRSVDYTVIPKLVADLSGQGGNAGLGGLQVPIRIVGPWSKPDIAPDLSKIDAKQAVQAVEEIGKRLKGKDTGEVVDELFGKDTKESKKAKKFLDKLFR